MIYLSSIISLLFGVFFYLLLIALRDSRLCPVTYTVTLAFQDLSVPEKNTVTMAAGLIVVTTNIL